MKRRNELQILVDKFKADANAVLARMVTSAFGGTALKPPPKRGGALLQMELERGLSAKAQASTKTKSKRRKKSAAQTHAEKLDYQRMWRIKKKQEEGKPLTKTQERWLKRYNARNK